MSYTHAASATPGEHAAATKLQALFRGHQQRVAFQEKRAFAAEIAEYDNASRERLRRMHEREEKKAMLKDLSAGEFEDWHERQEHHAAVVVQRTFRMHKAKQDVAKKKQELRSRPRAPRPVDPDTADILAASFEPAPAEFADDPITSPYRPPKPVEQIVAGLKMRYGLGELGVGTLTMEAYLEGRRKTDDALRRYRELAANASKAEAARAEKRRLAERSYRAYRAAAHGSLAELPANATPEQFPDPTGADPKHVRRVHQDLLVAARDEQKWWKPLIKLNKEQRVLDEKEAEMRKRDIPESRA
jgi:hypothetical protein